MRKETATINKKGIKSCTSIFFAFLRRIHVLDIHTLCFTLLVECQLKIQLKMLTVSTYNRGFHGYPFHWCTSVHYSPWVAFWYRDSAKYASFEVEIFWMDKLRYNNNSIQFFIIYVSRQQPQGQLQAQHSVDKNNYFMNKHNIKSKTS
jgi:hypothetical protein